MTREEQERLKQNAPAVSAYVGGKHIEVKTNGFWRDYLVEPEDGLSYLMIDIAAFEFRPKPEPVTRDWTASDVPPVCWLTHSNANGTTFMVIKIETNGVRITSRDSLLDWEELGAIWSHSADLREWKPCKIVEP